MASAQIAIAKAAFSAGLLRPDPSYGSVSRDEIASFHSKLEKALSQCSPANIQSCKSWLLNNIAGSSARTSVLGKYLVALSGSADPSSTAAGKRSPKRVRLHILYLLNDILHHAKHHGSDSGMHSTLSEGLEPHLVDLFERAGSFDPKKHPKYHKRLQNLLDIWMRNMYLSRILLDKLRNAVDEAAKLHPVTDKPSANGDNSSKATTSSVPYIMPARHGDPSTPFYDLPAGNMMPHIIPNSTAPIKPDLVRPLQFVAGPADRTLVDAVKSLMEDVDRIYNPSIDLDEGIGTDIDEMGQTFVRDEITNERIGGEAYYGWSRTFCEKMKQRRDGMVDEHSRGRPYSSSRSRSPSDGFRRRRRRYSDSRSRSPSYDRRLSISRSRSYDVSRSRSRHDRRPYRNDRKRSRSSSRSRSFDSRSRSPPRQRYRSRSRSLSRSYSPPSFPQSYPPPQQQQHHHHHQSHFPAPFHGPGSQAQQFAPPPPPPPISHNFPTPPPRPPNWTGPWPPPPPPLPPNMNFPPGPSNMPFLPFPPPPPPSQKGQSQFPPQFTPPPPQMQMPHSAFPQSHNTPGQGLGQGQGQWSQSGSPPHDGYGYGYNSRGGHGYRGRGRGRQR